LARSQSTQRTSLGRSFHDVELWSQGAPLSFELPLSETPIPKPQAPEKFQISNTKLQNRCRGKSGAGRFLSLELGFWNLELVAYGEPR